MTKWISARQYKGEKEVFHTDKNCQYVTPSSRKAENTNVDVSDLRECDYCAGRVQGRERQSTTCPFCKTEVKDLPDHLPCEASP